MRNILITAALVSGFMAATIKVSHAAENPCKALTGEACSQAQGCKWFEGDVQTHKVAGVEVTKTRKPACKMKLGKDTLIKSEPYQPK